MLPSFRVEALLRALGVPVEKFRIGTAKVFLKDDAFHKLEGKRNEYFHKAATKIQCHIRGHKWRAWYRRMRASCILLQHWLKHYIKTQDCSDAVESALDSIKKKETSKNVVDAVKTLESLCLREANVGTVVDNGGITAIVDALNVSEISQTADNMLKS